MKKAISVICFVISAVILLSCLPFGALGETDSFRLGDVNNDQTIDAKDALEALQYSVGKRGQFSGAPIWQYASDPPPTSTDVIYYSMPEKEFKSIEAFGQWVEGLLPPPENYAYELNTFWTYIQPCYQEMFYYDRFYVIPNVDASLTLQSCMLFPVDLNCSFTDEQGNSYWYSIGLNRVELQLSGYEAQEYNGKPFYIDREKKQVHQLIGGYVATTTLLKNEKGEVDLEAAANAFVKIGLPPMNDPVSLRLGDVTGDGKIDAKDALEILKYSVKKIDKFPVEELIPETPTDVPDTPMDVSPTDQ